MFTQMQTLSTRIGAHGFFCLVRASPYYNTSPKWYYLHEGMEDYLKFVVRRRWDPRLIGTQLEAFAISGCDINSECAHPLFTLDNFLTLYQDTFKSKTQKINYQTTRIRDMLGDKLGGFFYSEFHRYHH
jgi:hypothetical protein